MAKKIIIVGGVAGGASTAARLRRLDEASDIIMFEKGEFISFANCGLPYYIGETIKNRDNLLVQTVEGMSARFNMDIRNFSEVIKINTDKKTVEVLEHKTGKQYEESYDVLVLSPGANPVRPPIPGLAECTNLFTLRNIPDMDKIKEFTANSKPRSAVIVGGGFIGLEMAENLHELGIKVTLVEMTNQVMAPLVYEMACIVHNHLLDKKVNLILGDGVKQFTENGKKIELSSGKIIDGDIIILSIGVAPETRIAKEAGLKLNARNAVVVDKNMKTSDPNIYAIGDAVEVTDYVNCTPTMIPLAWPANRQGRIVADNICGRNTEYKGTLGSSVAKVFDLTVAATGNNEKILKRLNIDYKVLHIHPGSHAGYYPGAFPISLKLIFAPDSGKIYGAQAVGFDGVEKRIDVIATAIKGNLTVYDLPDVELCYAPPYSSAKDPVNMAGYVASNILDGIVETVQWHEIDEIVSSGGFILDIRDTFEVSLGEISGSKNIPLSELRKRAGELPKDTTIYVYCQVGLRGYIACRILTQLGYKCKNIDGGYKTYALTRGINGDKGAQLTQNTSDTGVVEKMTNTNNNNKPAVSLDACGLQCPGPIKKVFEEMSKLDNGQVLEILATDPGFAKDISSWCKNTGNTLIGSEFSKEKKAFVATIQKGSSCTLSNMPIGSAVLAADNKQGSTMVVFSGDLDKAIASFIIATGAASMGKHVTMFFTFWGLNILKRKQRPKVKKDIIEKMFDFMLPSHTGKLPLSKMQMGGMGPKMIKMIMKRKNVDDIDTLIKNAINMGVKVIACSMSMDLMGIKKEELIDGVEIGGVATYLASTDEAGLNLFI
jgi:CoA-disulfide reductase